MVGLWYNIILIIIGKLGREGDIYVFKQTSIPWFVFCIALCSIITYIVKDCSHILVLVTSFALSLFACYDSVLMQHIVLAKTVGWFPMFYLGYLMHSKSETLQVIFYRKIFKNMRWLRPIGGAF